MKIRISKHATITPIEVRRLPDAAFVEWVRKGAK